MWKYVAKEGEYLPGIPAQDISDEEAEALGVVETLKASRIYRHVSDRQSPAAPEKDGGD